MCADGIHVPSGDVRTMLLKSRFKSGGLCPSLDDYHRSPNVLGASLTGEFVLLEQKD